MFFTRPIIDKDTIKHAIMEASREQEKRKNNEELSKKEEPNLYAKISYPMQYSYQEPINDQSMLLKRIENLEKELKVLKHGKDK